MAKIIHYKCTHCGKAFDAPEQDIVECPGCFWSTSVKAADDASPKRSHPAAARPQKASPKPAVGLPKFNFSKAMNTWIIPAVLILVFVFIIKGTLGWMASRPPKETAVTIKPDAVKKDGAPAADPLGRLTADEIRILDRRSDFKADRSVSAEERAILDRQASFKTGFVQKLPTPSWTVENFEEMIAKQEALYKVPLPKSYKKKLTSLFQETYLPAQQAFEAGGLQQARDLWIGSLAIPKYSEDIQKHRGVALTILRPYINDTLSRIGALNQMLTETTIRGKEEEISALYGNLLELLKKDAWSDASAVAAELDKKSSDFGSAETFQVHAPPYPEITRQIDPDIQATLMELYTAPVPAVADVEPVKSDLANKMKIIQSFFPEALKRQEALYQDGLDRMARKEWAEAIRSFEQIEYPLALWNDAREKVKVLKKIQEAGA